MHNNVKPILVMRGGTLDDGAIIVTYMIRGDSNIFCAFMSSR